MFTIRSLKVNSISADDPVEFFLDKAVNMLSIKRTVCFYRMIGINGSDHVYIDTIKSIDHAAQKLSSPYVRINNLDAPPPGDAQALKKLSRKWLDMVNAEPIEIMKVLLPMAYANETIEWTAKKAFCKVLDIYRTNMTYATETIYENFAVKMLYWIERYIKPLFQKEYFPKIVFTGEAKKHESLFLFYCASIGCDVLYIHPCVDVPIQFPELLTFSNLHETGVRRNCEIAMPEYVDLPVQPKQTPRPVQHLPEPKSAVPVSQNTERTYEELAMLTASVVMIGVFNSENECEKTGSGVVINENGLILTNWHVVSGGNYYAVRFENDAKDYLTDTIIKYHTNHDLAIIRVEKCSRPIPLAREKTLVRGQKVMAIGSPLGLFNTVSDGIISGFRQIKGTDMIQFTAPTSGGSSGGALIDMYARLVGIIQGGFDAGQNLNLAVDYRVVSNFVRTLI